MFIGFSHILTEFSLGIWSDPEFAPWIGDVSRLVSEKSFKGDNHLLSPYPKGLETLAFVSDPNIINLLKSPKEEAMSGLMNLIRKRNKISLDTLCPIRNLAHMKTVTNALKVAWLHEVVHIIYGHLDIISKYNKDTLHEAELFDFEDHEAPLPLIKMLEFIADDESLSLIFSDNYSDPINVIDIKTHQYNSTISAISCLLPNIIYYANNVFRKQDDNHLTHPPLWFRAYHVLVSHARIVHNKKNTRELSSEEVLLGGAASINSLSNLHPLIKNWMGTIDLDTYDRFVKYSDNIVDNSKEWHEEIFSAAGLNNNK